MDEGTAVPTENKRRISLQTLETQSSAEEVRIGITEFANSNPVGDLVLKVVKMPVIDQYRDINVGIGRRKGDHAAARSFLFKKAFLRFEPLPDAELDLSGELSELAFFLKCEKLIDRVLIEYLNQTYPDLDLGK